MMNKDPEIFDYDLDLEDILKPRAEFRVSPALKQKVIAEAKSMPIRRRHRWIPFVVSSAAAAVATLIIITAVHFLGADSSVSEPPTTAAIEKSVMSTADSLKKEEQTLLIAEAAPAIDEKKASTKRTMKKKTATKGVATTDIENPTAQESKPQPVTEGEMPMISRETSQDPDDVRTRLIEMRRNAEIAYIERMRDEIEANQAYIAQLMADVNVNR